MKKIFIFILSIVFLVIFIVYPSEVSEGSKNGLILWFKTVLPALLPYMIITNIIVNCGFLENIKSSKESFFTINTFLCISIGLLCGYPMGAIIITKNYKKGFINKYCALWMLNFANMCSPAFIIQYIILENLSGRFMVELLISIYGGTIIYAIFSLPFFYFKQKKKLSGNSKENIKEIIVSNATDVPDSMLDAFNQALKLCSYIVLFSITVNMVTALNSTVTIKQIIIIGLLEITNGIKYLCNSGISIGSIPVLCAFFTSFGSISCIFQTSGICAQGKLPISKYVISKLIQGLISVIIMIIIY